MTVSSIIARENINVRVRENIIVGESINGRCERKLKRTTGREREPHPGMCCDLTSSESECRFPEY
jgi:hypothetical protein